MMKEAIMKKLGWSQMINMKKFFISTY